MLFCKEEDLFYFNMLAYTLYLKESPYFQHVTLLSLLFARSHWINIFDGANVMGANLRLKELLSLGYFSN